MDGGRVTPEDVPEGLVWLATEAAFPLLQTPRDAVRLESAEKHTRAALAAVLSVHEQMVRARVLIDLAVAAERFFPGNAAVNQTLHQAARIAEIGLEAYDEENQ